MTRVACLAVGVLAVSGMAAAADPDPRSLAVSAADAARAADLVRQLGSPVFRDREDAGRELRGLGRKALPALRAGLDSDDAEIRDRCKPLIEPAEVADFNARLETFLADTDGKFDHDLRGWNEFQKWTGNDGRGLFADVMKSPANRELVSGVAYNKAELARRLDARRRNLYASVFPSEPARPLPAPFAVPVPPATSTTAKRYAPTLSDTVAFLFADTIVGDAEHPASRPAGRLSGSMLLNRPSVRTAFETDTNAAAARKIVAAWADSRTTPGEMLEATGSLEMLKMKQATGVAVRLVQDPTSTALYKVTALETIGRVGTAEQLPFVRGLFADNAITCHRGDGDNLRVCDTALAMALRLTGQSRSDYGFRTLQIPGKPDDVGYANQGFPTDAARTAGFAKFAAWEAKNPPAAAKSPAGPK